MGSRKNPVWRVVAADGRSKRDGRVLEIVGRYNPQRQPSEIVLDRERIDHWLARGAQPSDTVRKLIRAVERGAPPATAASDSAPAATAVADAPEADEAPAADGVTSEEPIGEAASADESASVADAAPADEGGTADSSEG